MQYRATSFSLYDLRLKIFDAVYYLLQSFALHLVASASFNQGCFCWPKPVALV